VKIFHSPNDAKEFFVQKVLEQATMGNIPLSDVEKQMLLWNETDPNFYGNHELNERFEKEISPEEYEKKITKLIRGCYDDDLRINNIEKGTYKRAYKAIKSKKYYIFIMVDRAIGKDINKLGYFFGMYDSSNEYILKIILYGLLFVFFAMLFVYENDFTFYAIKTRGTYLFCILVFGIQIFLNLKSYIEYKKDSIFSNKLLAGKQKGNVANKK